MRPHPLVDLEEAARPFRFLIRDRDAKYTGAFDTVLADAGTEVIKTPTQAPRVNSYAERWVGTARRECTDRLLITGRRHLTVVLGDCVEHCNRHRPHQSLDQQPPHPPTSVTWPHTGSAILCRAVLGGLTSEYERAALPSESPAQGTNPGFEAAQARGAGFMRRWRVAGGTPEATAIRGA